MAKPWPKFDKDVYCCPQILGGEKTWKSCWNRSPTPYPATYEWVPKFFHHLRSTLTCKSARIRRLEQRAPCGPRPLRRRGTLISREGSGRESVPGEQIRRRGVNPARAPPRRTSCRAADPAPPPAPRQPQPSRERERPQPRHRFFFWWDLFVFQGCFTKRHFLISWAITSGRRIWIQLKWHPFNRRRDVSSTGRVPVSDRDREKLNRPPASFLRFRSA
jgi:hypothetical protein